MRFDKKCKDCVYFKKVVPMEISCPNNKGDVWNPSEKACDDFKEKLKPR